MASKKVVVAIYDARGGPEKAELAADGYVAGRTDAGRFVIAFCDRHSSASRYAKWSKIRWGSKLKEEGGVLMVEHEGKWRKLSDVTQATKKELLDYYELLYGKRELPDTGVFNDFGSKTCYYFGDKNNNRKLDVDKGEKIHPEFLHTTPDTVAQTKLAQSDPTVTVQLTDSHGCVHLKPADMAALVKNKYFARGNTIVVHRHSETPCPRS